jgi:hypothetical protein
MDESLEKTIKEILAVKTMIGRMCRTPKDCSMHFCYFTHETPSGLSQKAERLLEKAKKQDAHKVEALQAKPKGTVVIVAAKEEVKDEIASQLECAICIVVMTDPMTATPCMHNFCKVCIEQWMKTSYMKECPMCKVKIQDLKKNTLVASLIEVINKKK